MAINTRAWAYLVVSSEDQSDTIPRQLAWAIEEAHCKGWTIDRVFDGVASGRDGVRAIFDQMLAALKATPREQRPEYVLMTRLDRIGRGHMVESQVVLHEVHALGTKVWTREGGEVKLDNAMDALIAAVKLAVGSQENEVRRDKALSVYDARRKARVADPRRALTSKGPYGTRFEGGYLVPQHPEAEAVRLMFDLRLQGYGAYVIARRLSEVAPPIVQKNGVTRDLRWSSDLVSRLMKKRAYVEAGVLTESEFQRAQALISNRGGSHPKVYEWPLVGAIRCECGCAMRGVTNQRNKLYYYGCPDRYRVHGKFVCHRREKIEQQFWSILYLVGTTPIFADAEAEDEQRARKLLMTKLTSVRSELAAIASRVRGVWEAFDAGNLRQETLQGRLDALAAKEQDGQAEAARLEAELAVLNSREMTAQERAALVKSAPGRWRRAKDVDERKAIAKQLSMVLGGLVIRTDGALLVRGVPALVVNE